MPDVGFGYGANGSVPRAAPPGTWEAPPNQIPGPDASQPPVPSTAPFLQMYDQRGRESNPTVLPYAFQHGFPRLDPNNRMPEGDYRNHRGQWCPKQ